MMKQFVALTFFLLVACSNPVHRLEVTGVEGQFCVPKTGYIAPRVAWVPKDAFGIPKGFSFGGCHRLKEADPEQQAACTLPADFISSDVEPLQIRRNRTWSELKESADFNLLVNSTGAEYAIDSSSGFLVVSNRNSESTWQSRGWAIWRRNSYFSADDPLTMQDGDELVAVCSKIENFPRSAGIGQPGEYGCDSYVRGKRYALNYRFISARKVPTEVQMKSLEASLFDQVDRWRCKK